MYDELVQKLRSVKDSLQTEEKQWMLEAADAIETLCGMVAIAYQENANSLASYEEDKPTWLYERSKLCVECDSDTCAYNPEGVCILPFGTGCEPRLSDDGCEDWVQKE